MHRNNDPNITQRLYAQLLQDDQDQGSPEFPTDFSSPPSLQLQVELQNGSKVYLSPNPQDEPQRLARLFCKQHNLQAQMIEVLAQSIRQSIAYSKGTHKQQVEEHELDITPQYSEVLLTEPCTFTHQEREQERENQVGSVSKKTSIASQWSIYEKGRQFEEKHKLWIARQRQQKSKQEEKQCTYQPKINALSRSIISERSNSQVTESHISQRQSSSTVRQRQSITLTSLSRSVSNNYLIESDIPDLFSQQGKSCQLKERDMNRYNSNVFLELYQNKRGTKQPKGNVEKPSYKPSINSISRDIVGDTKFTERMIKYQQDSRVKKQKRKASEMQDKYNLHRPKIGPTPKNRNMDRLPIGDFLYQKKKKTIVMSKPQPVPVISQTSRQIYERSKQEAFQRVFDSLAGEQETVCWKNLNLQVIDKNIVSLLAPLLEELQIMKIELEKGEFIAALTYLFGTLTPAEKHKLMTFGLDKADQNQPSHKRRLNKKSRQMVERSGRGEMNISQFCSWRQSIREDELERRRVEKERAEMDQCTFQPKVLRKVTYF